MKLISHFFCLILAQVSRVRAECDGNTNVNINGVYHDVVLLVGEMATDVTGLVGVDSITDDLYYTYNDFLFPPLFAKINLKTKKEEQVYVHRYMNTSAIDSYAMNHEDREIYMYAATDGIYKYHLKNDTVTFFGAQDKNITRMYYKNKLYFLSDDKWYVFNESSYSLFEDLENIQTRNFIIDHENVIYFYNETGLYRKKAGGDTVLIKLGEGFAALAVDPEGRVYTIVDEAVLIPHTEYYGVLHNTTQYMNELYLVNRDTLQLEALMQLQHSDVMPTRDPTFDNDGNIIYIETFYAYTLIPDKNKMC